MSLTIDRKFIRDVIVGVSVVAVTAFTGMAWQSLMSLNKAIHNIEVLVLEVKTMKSGNAEYRKDLELRLRNLEKTCYVCEVNQKG